MIESYDINDYLKDDKELQKAVIRELFKEITTQQDEIDAYKSSENEANEIIAELKAENERLKEEINDFISDISTCGFKYDGRCPDDLDELQSSIEYLCNKFDNYKHTLQEIKAIAEDAYENDSEYQATGVYNEIIQKITKAEEE